MKVILGSIIIILLLLFGLWLLLSPTFEKIGDKTVKVKNILKEKEEKQNGNSSK
ncbi:MULTISPECIES: hypothetical protein [unclassified Bacillus (in: firmicutes)]|uniref:hypothetical protein n=1 Tax=unclassified Bacillus (in: firmicutes) TaxID=185979 RepID=UPI0015CF4C53|nr:MULTISPECIES: hypothetical protein [unclassified Bacillus (in: firmicutes)]